MKFPLIFLSLLSISLFAKELSLKSQTRLNIELSTEGMNRLFIKGDRITKLVSQEDSLKIEGDPRDGSLFISPRMPKNSKVYATLFTEKGFMQNLTFTIKADIAPVTLALNPRASRPLRVKARRAKKTFKNKNSKQILSLLKAILEGRVQGHEISVFCHKESVSFKDVTRFQKNKLTVTRLPSRALEEFYQKDSKAKEQSRLAACFGRVRAATVDGKHLYVVSEEL